MKCYICDVSISEPSFNSDTNAYEPCDHCMSIIMDTVGNWYDRPSAAEDELGDESLTAYGFTVREDFEE